jgi:hypothetical protein
MSTNKAGLNSLKSQNLLNVKSGSNNNKNNMTLSSIAKSSTTNELKLNSLQEPTTPRELNTPKTVTVYRTFFPPSPTPIDNEIAITGFLFYI